MKSYKRIAHSLSEYVDVISQYKPYKVCFRGEGDYQKALNPSLMRNDSGKEEKELIMDVVMKHPEFFQRMNLRNHLNTLSLLRQYVQASRLMDVSWNPLVSLFMALDSDKDMDAYVYVFDMKDENIKIKYANSDTVLALTCLAWLSDKDKNELEDVCRSLPNGGILDDYLYHHENSVKHLYHEIRGEYPAYDCEIRAKDLLSSFFVLSDWIDRRMVVQNGFYILFGLDIENNRKKLLDKADIILIPKECRDGIRENLELCGIDSSSIYPGIERDIELQKKHK